MKPLMPLSNYWNMLEDHSMLINPRNEMQVNGLGLINSWDHKINAVSVIQGPGYEAARESARALNLDVAEFASYNFLTNLPSYCQGVELKNLIIPPAHQSLTWVNQVRLMNHRLEYHEVARVFDHMTIWHHCMVQGRPHIVLESSARLDSLPMDFVPRNSIIGLDTGGKLHEHNTNYRVMPGPWAYVIDQFSAKRMFNRVLEQGIREPLELMFRADQHMILLKDHAHRVVNYTIHTKSSGSWAN